MVSNLLGNAISHGDPDSPVVVHAETIGDRGFEFWVSNSGDLIPEETMGRLFQPFVRGEARRC
jgi:signal transduction histidine kinase